MCNLKTLFILLILNFCFASLGLAQLAHTNLSQTTQEAASIEEVQTAMSLNSGDQAWLLLCTALVLLMTPGLALFYGGLVSHKNVISILMQCMMCMGLVTILWTTIGFGLAFGEDVLGGFVGNPFQYLLGSAVAFNKEWEIVPGVPAPISQASFMMFQCMFAIIAPGLMIGAFAERMKFGAFTVFSGLWLLVVYCPVAHWVWYGPTGFFALASFNPSTGVPTGALDFAGGTVVHINAGIAALVCCLYLGQRSSFLKQPLLPHNMPMAVMGTGLLWFGWFGFNGGSSLAANDQAVRAVTTTHIAAAAGAFAWALLEWRFKRKPTALGTISGAIAGLVSITPAAGFVDISAALWIGLIGSLVGYWFVHKVKNYFQYDDTLDVFGIHGMAGVWGAVATGIFAIPGYGFNEAGGLLYGNAIQVWLQVKAAGFTVVYSSVSTLTLLILLDKLFDLKAKTVCSCVGLDRIEHAEDAYVLEAMCHECDVIDHKVLMSLTQCLAEMPIDTYESAKQHC